MAGVALGNRRTASATKQRPVGRGEHPSPPRGDAHDDVETLVAGTSAGRIARLAAKGIALAMIGCSIALWSVVPAATVFALPRLFSPDVGIPVVLVCVFGAMAVMMKVITSLYGLYCRLMASPPPLRSTSAWLRSTCEPATARPKPTFLEAVIVASTLLSIVSLGVWFFAFAQCSQALCAA